MPNYTPLLKLFRGCFSFVLANTSSLRIDFVLLSITTYGVMQTILSKTAIQCACLGTALNLPMTEATLIENGIMIVMSCIMILGFIL